MHTNTAGGFRLDVQGLRAVAVGIVVAYHAGVSAVAGGFVGVDVFFVISGFLITQHLVRELDGTGRVSLPGFYARRIRRIIPAAAFVAILTMVASFLLLSPVRVIEVARDAIATALFVPNLWFAWGETDYLTNADPSPFQHYWSLGVEEQFYLLWPGIVLLAALVLRSRRGIAIVMGVIAVGSFTASQVMLASSPTWTFFSLHTRAWEFAIGGLLGLAMIHRPAWFEAVPRMRVALGWVGLAAILVPVLVYDETTPFPGAAALAPVVGTALILATGVGAAPRLAVASVLALRPLVFIGLVSYSIYLLHWPAMNLAGAVTDGAVPAPVMVAIVVLLVPAAWLMHRYVERPFTTRPALARRRPRAYFAGAFGVAAASVVLALGITASIGAAPQTTDQAVSELAVAPDAPLASVSTPTAPDFVPSNVSPAIVEAENDVPSLYGSGCHEDPGDIGWDDCRYGELGSDTTVALFGDSHAANWFPALEVLADEHGFELRSFTKSWCPSADVTTVAGSGFDETCAPWRDAVIEELVASKPDLVIMGNYAAAPEVSSKEWSEGVASVVEQLSPTSRVLVMADLADFDDSPPECLSDNIDSALDCAEPLRVAVDAETNAVFEKAALAHGGSFADLQSWVCPEGTCPAILGNVLTYRDEHHLTATFSRSLAPAVWDEVAPLLQR